MKNHEARRKRLTAILKEEKLDALLINNPTNVTYLTGFSGDSSALLLGERRGILVSDGRFTEQIAEECPGLEPHIRPSSTPLSKAIAEVVEKLGFHNLGFESGYTSVADLETLRELLPTVDWKPARDRVERLRAIKDSTEIDEIREAIHIAEKAFAMFRALIRPSDCEKDLSDAMEMYIRRAGGRCASFPTIVAAGPRAALAHAPPTERRVDSASLLLVDWGASGRFYKSDLTRILIPRNHSAFSRPAPRGKMKAGDAKLEKVHGVVLAAQQEAIKKIRPGVKACDVDAAARGVIADAGFGSFFIHGLGHGVGLQIHEAPSLRIESKDVLQTGMVVTVEPGIYLPGWGGVRLEDDILVTAEGCEVLTSVPKDLGASTLDF